MSLSGERLPAAGGGAITTAHTSKWDLAHRRGLSPMPASGHRQTQHGEAMMPPHLKGRRMKGH